MMPEISLVGVLIVAAVAFVVPLTLGLVPALRVPSVVIEIMAMIQIAMMGNLPYTVLRDAVFAHPTLAESLNTLFSSVEHR